MKVSRLLLATVFALLITAPATAQENRIYEHPELDFQFAAPPGFERQPRPEDHMIYEVAEPGTGVHAVLWFTTTEQDALHYLLKMADMKGLAVIACGKSKEYPKENALYIVEIWSPARSYDDNAQAMGTILDSVKILGRISHHGSEYPLYPQKLSTKPELPSPFTAADGSEIVVAGTRDGEYTLIPVTVENGAPNNYRRDLWGKGRQLAVDAEEFPTLARTGLHAESELERDTITGRAVSEITAEALPEESSHVGFVASDEDLLSVIRGDNRLVTRLGLTHPRLAQPLFNVFNVTLREVEVYRRGQGRWNEVEFLLWNDRRIYIENSGAKGWQESIFNDEVMGYFHLDMWRELEPEEERYLRERYGSLGEDRLEELRTMLSRIETGEMVPFYITRYGFYEGHTGYRADPVSIASVFGLLSIPEIDAALDGDLYGVLTRHYRPAP